MRIELAYQWRYERARLEGMDRQDRPVREDGIVRWQQPETFPSLSPRPSEDSPPRRSIHTGLDQHGIFNLKAPCKWAF